LTQALDLAYIIVKDSIYAPLRRGNFSPGFCFVVLIDPALEVPGREKRVKHGESPK
jgi:allophanate hydrolase subunit 1